MFKDNRRFQTETREFLRQIPWRHPVAVTLTMKQRVDARNIDLQAASKNFRHFLNRLNRVIFKNAAKRFDRGVRVFPICEHSADIRYHYHAIIDRPDNLDMDAFHDLIRASWLKTRWGYREMVIKDVRDGGWANYMTKFASKPSFLDSIDWENLRID